MSGSEQIKCPSDNCPKCLEGPNRPTVVMRQANGDGVQGLYGCRACGYVWFCSWSDDAVEAWAPPVEPGGAA